MAAPVRVYQRASAGHLNIFVQFYRVKNWHKFQHYKDRNPPWIKLHFEILSSTDWVTLDDASRVLAVASMLIASRNEGAIPADPHYMKRVAYLNKLPNFKPLVDCGFLEILQADASALQADARPETETYREETEKESKSLVRAVRGTRLPKEWDLPQQWGEWAATLGVEAKEINFEAEKFKDYWIAKAGSMATKTDWEATWRNWIRKSMEGKNNGLYTKRV